MPRIISSVKALIKHKNKYLFLYLTLSKKSGWSLPGGQIEYGEEPKQALLREVKEETGLRITINRSIGLWWFYTQKDQHQVICHTYLCEANTDKIDLTHNPANEPITDFKWFIPKDILNDKKIVLAPSLRKLLLSYIKRSL
ncbi:hypothetical protein A2313_04975 [Candidatus Roizmanbacteria bacterium RIFOXYB2_FULL_41_10]|uniref:Nudix hydrolase domain-containing protein n=1 Tax=Candidatus Roizmanbacteria bacterium RIFOXYA1_FULL_41_12 TaxID=1802082 RepID=A0A1F7KFJ6_9BACT|nr:MAG: hypothetical protein A2209_00050 [Candidatus Roizmanbacteria bacterium RIFOXYA1_FULL_41_12]OGK67634.1 MAG: hypothetical protein A2377_00685 [Candidatus Roizmanbacteria bacterium RIFOXYB1_FULL_41_27]OGK67888.1 MAG: hypothetical protein A2262_00665 [Candidatus Roizmanbacteria bacterium RIFOXYA2_FULL_41_8]OGK69357.1 MAG: hypothetical protein A2313_04975 [Candidatus Roizmanbacteria bacterium RIFOXYB2_FULL_41_10]OGK71356.1 MAG: hypothetical protein A2403_01070 [Candidatus Roizmanbacteria bac